MRRGQLHLLTDTDETWFPPLEHALEEPNGLLAVGGSLSPDRLTTAYARGIFPWYEEDQPILWWSPDPRAVLYPERLKVARSLRKRIRNGGFRITMDTCFDEVIRQCAAPRKYSDGTWITDAMRDAYLGLHERGLGHSVEVWRDTDLVGGLYGVALGRAFFGESMFSRVSDASKTALVYLVRQLERWGYKLVDCQVSSPHLAFLGATDIPRREFARQLAEAVKTPSRPGPWTLDPDFDPLAARTI